MNFIRRFFAGISSILSVLWPDPDYWQYWPTDMDDEPRSAPGILDKQRATYNAEQVREASDVVEWLSDAYHYSDAAHVGWSADDLRVAAEDMQQ